MQWMPGPHVPQHVDKGIMTGDDVIQILDIQIGLVLKSEVNLYPSATIQHGCVTVPPCSLSYQLSFSSLT